MTASYLIKARADASGWPVVSLIPPFCNIISSVNIFKGVAENTSGGSVAFLLLEHLTCLVLNYSHFIGLI